tara:strand:- start:82 stop:642 length:561 start_codon:yes stop_codon:yes gene_type:complete
MSNLKFTKKEIKKFIDHYTSEKNELEKKLNHVNEMLAKLSGNVVISTSKDTEEKLTAKGEIAKKRGPKSVWGKFITNRLRARKKPMSYDELIDDAMSLHKISDERKANARASILNAAYRLRTVSGEITTVGRKGRKEKLIVRTSWLNTDGSLQEPYAKEFKKIKGGKAEKVDMSKIPVSKYETTKA